MKPEHTSANIQSWAEVGEFVEWLPDPVWTEWKALARRFLLYGADRNFNQHFRASTSMRILVFSTLDHGGASYEPVVKVCLLPPETVKLRYFPATPAAQGDTRLEYELDFDEGMSTFQRFLNHLWEMTMPEPLPADMRSPACPFSAPVLAPSEAKITREWRS